MKSIAAVILSLIAASAVFAQEEQEFVTETSCSLSIKTTVYPVDSSDRYGKVAIDGLLTDSRGNPLADQRIRISSTTGGFSCMPPVQFGDAEISTSLDGCLQTQEDGTFKIYLVKIPFNRPGIVKAVCTYGNFKVSATGSYSITKWSKSTARKKKDWKPKKRIPMSGEL